MVDQPQPKDKGLISSEPNNTEKLDLTQPVEVSPPEHDVVGDTAVSKDVEAIGEKLAEQKSQQSEAIDPYLVTWNGLDDPANPRNWTFGKKWGAVAIISFFTFISPVSSSIVAPALPQLGEDLGIGSEFERAMVLSIFLLSYAIGPLLFGPLSELYGRVRVVQLSNIMYFAFNLACGFTTNGSQMLAFRFWAGFGGSAMLALGGGILADCFAPESRGQALGLYLLGPLLGPAVGPVAGGFIAENTTWRWCFWSTTVLCAVVQFVGFFFLRETYAPVLLQRRAAQLRKEKDDPGFYTTYDQEDRRLFKLLSVALVRPFRMMTQPIVIALGLYNMYNYGLMYLILSTFPRLWTEVYGQSVGMGGLNYISLGIGFWVAMQVTSPLNDRIYRKLKAKNGGIGKPEFRVPLMFVSSTICPIGLFTYAWTAQNHTHWIGPNIGAALFCAGAIIIHQTTQTYVIDVYTLYAASATATVVVLRSLAGFGFPLFAPYMYESLDYGWGNSLLGFVSVGIGVPVPVLIWFYGEKLRSKSSFAVG